LLYPDLNLKFCNPTILKNKKHKRYFYQSAYWHLGERSEESFEETAQAILKPKYWLFYKELKL
jgi:hypothetical protein